MCVTEVMSGGAKAVRELALRSRNRLGASRRGVSCCPATLTQSRPLVHGALASRRGVAHVELGGLLLPRGSIVEEETIGSEVVVNVGTQVHIDSRDVVLHVKAARLGSWGKTDARSVLLIVLTFLAVSPGVHLLESQLLSVLLLFLLLFVPQITPALRDSVLATENHGQS